MSKSLQKLVFAGAGAYPETYYIIDAINEKSPAYDVIGILDDSDDMAGKEVNGVPVIGKLADAASLDADVKFVFGIGSHRNHFKRPDILAKMGVPDERFETIIHPLADVFKTSSIGPGCIVHPRVVIGQEVVMEGFNVVFPNTVVASRNKLGKFSLLTALVSLTDRVQIGPCAFIGTFTCIAEGVKIGAGARVSMGSAVFKNIPEGAIVFGNPLKFIGKNEIPESVKALI